MISNPIEYERACEELSYLEEWLSQLQEEHPGAERGLTKAGIRTLIARLHEELAAYEGQLEVEESHPSGSASP